jgi:hypothetical protein
MSLPVRLRQAGVGVRSISARWKSSAQAATQAAALGAGVCEFLLAAAAISWAAAR